MYAGDTSSTLSQGNTKSTIQALLKNREQRPVANKSIPTDSSNDKVVLNNYSGASDFSNFVALPKKLEFDTKDYSSEHVSPNSLNSQENSDYQKDFNYSQKLFHIADGNLYSIFSPIQGRSYGMKPSFLRKQKYTVQECHSRGRKNLRKGLKFHNFLPSESVTSEKDNGFLNTKWKVHSECRLREEHGTKQITISNWSQSIQNPDETHYSAKNSSATASSSSPEINSTESSLKVEDGLDCQISDPYDFNLSLQSANPLESTDIQSKMPKIRSESTESLPASNAKKDSLSFVLNSLLEKPSFSEKRSSSPDEIEILNKSLQKHRRKPVQTRRVVPYVKYLSILEENESLPLDLSSKCLIDASPSQSVSSCDESPTTSRKIDFDFNNSLDYDKQASSSHASLNEMRNTPPERLITGSNNLDGIAQTPVAVLYPVPFGKSATNLGQNGFHPVSIQGPSSAQLDVNLNQNFSDFNISVEKPCNSLNQSFQNNTAFSVQKSYVKEVQSKPRRRNQRSVIKQKLEDTFRQNGFLVKTKQVSDGEATFCKFRQLRKYTRYYLKSLEQHLPDEFHKMWKGFLPPKTVLPPALGTPEPSNDSG